jgi:hypothetical protein
LVASAGFSIPTSSACRRRQPALHGGSGRNRVTDQTDDESADPDWAVDVMERLYFYLGQADRSMLLREIQKLIDYGRKAKWPSKLITMLKKEYKHFSEDK